jgi:hypothetical protein
MDPVLLLRFLLLGGSALVIVAIGYTLIWMVRRSRDVGQQRKRKTKAAQRRVDAAVERHELGQSTITVPDRFEALGPAGGAGGAGGEVVLTSEPQPGDLSSTMIVPQPPFDVTDGDTWRRWEAAGRKERRATMLAGYLAHPLPRVRAEALELLSSSQVRDPQLALRVALLLLDDDRALRTRAARAAWAEGRLAAVVGALHERADPAALPRAYTDLENAAPRDEGLSLPRAFAGRHTEDGDEAAAVAELVELYSPDRAADRDAVGDLGRRLDVQGGGAARDRAVTALRAARGHDAALDAAGRWDGIGP